MTDLTTYFLYISLLFIVIYGTYIIGPKRQEPAITERKKLNVLYFLVLLVISFIVGFRYQVGVDWAGYVEIFEEVTRVANISVATQYYEWGYFWINRTIGLLGLGYEWMFFIMAFITWYLYFKSVPRVLIPLLIYFLFVNEYFFWGMNGVRQFAAMAVWVYSLRYLINKDLKQFLVFIFIASLFHASALFLIPFYFMPYEKLYKRYIWLSIFLCSLVFVFLFDLSALHHYIELLAFTLSKYVGAAERYVRYIQNKGLVAQEIQLGLGFFFKIIVNGFIIWVSADLIKYKPKLKPYFILFFIGAIIFNLFYDFQLINRFNHYFFIIKSILLAYICYYFWFKDKRRYLVISITILYFIIFISAIYNSSNMCCPYQLSI